MYRKSKRPKRDDTGDPFLKDGHEVIPAQGFNIEYFDEEMNCVCAEQKQAGIQGMNEATNPVCSPRYPRGKKPNYNLRGHYEAIS